MGRGLGPRLRTRAPLPPSSGAQVALASAGSPLLCQLSHHWNGRGPSLAGRGTDVGPAQGGVCYPVRSHGSFFPRPRPCPLRLHSLPWTISLASFPAPCSIPTVHSPPSGQRDLLRVRPGPSLLTDQRGLSDPARPLSRLPSGSRVPQPRPLQHPACCLRRALTLTGLTDCMLIPHTPARPPEPAWAPEVAESE